LKAAQPDVKSRKFLLLALALAVAGALFYFVAVREPTSIVLTGVVTTDEIRVGALIQGRIEELDVAPGDTVEKGQMLARIQPQEPKADVAYYKNMEQASAAAVAQAKAELKFFEEQTRDQIRQAEANVAVTRAQARQAEADLESARLEFERQKQLRERQLNSAQALDEARTAYAAAQARSESLVKQVQAAEAALSVAQASQEQIGSHKAELESAGEQRAAAGAQTAKAEVRLAYTEIRAPISGIVDVRAALTGEVVTPGQTIVTLIDPDGLWVRADVEESYIDGVHLGDKLNVRLPSGAARECEVFFRGVDADYATQRDVSRTKRDIKTFEIRLRCDNGDRSLALGMSAYVTLPLSR
jgi:HlyD family secretion protein